MSDTDKSELNGTIIKKFNHFLESGSNGTSRALVYIEAERLMTLITQQCNQAWANGWAQRSKEEDYSAVIGKLKAMKPQDNAFFVIGEIERVVAELQAQAKETENK